eukprot:460896-Amphidinium_carterae.1
MNLEEAVQNLQMPLQCQVPPYSAVLAASHCQVDEAQSLGAGMSCSACGWRCMDPGPIVREWCHSFGCLPILWATRIPVSQGLSLPSMAYSSDGSPRNASRVA